jgi:pheromone shutdown protein TraB
MERFGTTCSGKLFWVWGLYAGVVAMLGQLIAAAHLPSILAWLMAGALGAATLAATGDV